MLYRGDDIGALSGERMRKLRSKLQIIFQDPYASLNPKMRISAILGEALSTHGLHKARRARVQAHRQSCWRHVGLRAEHASRFPHEFSGGQRQRIGVARARGASRVHRGRRAAVGTRRCRSQSQVINLLADLRERLGLHHALHLARPRRGRVPVRDRVVVLYLGQGDGGGRDRRAVRAPSRLKKKKKKRAPPPPPPPPPGAAGRGPEARSRRSPTERIALKGDIPSPISPPSGLRVPALPARHRGLRANACRRSTRFPVGHYSACIRKELLSNIRRMTVTAATTSTSTTRCWAAASRATRAPSRRACAAKSAPPAGTCCAGDLPLPLAVLKREALEHNLAWMQSRVREWGIDLAPHGKTTMSPQLFQRQLDAGA